MPSTGFYFNDSRGRRQDSINDHIQVDEDTNDLSTSENGGTIATRAAAMEVEMTVKAAFPTQHQVFRCGQRTCEMKASGVGKAGRLTRFIVSFLYNCYNHQK